MAIVKNETREAVNFEVYHRGNKKLTGVKNKEAKANSASFFQSRYNQYLRQK